jgi:hypothetical protein
MNDYNLKFYVKDVYPIVIQGHCPVIRGNRSRSSLELVTEEGEDFDFWNILKEYDVDLYFGRM